METNVLRRRAVLQMLLCAALWSIAGIFMKMIPWNGFVIAGFRSLVAGLTTGGYLLFARIPMRFTKRSLLYGFFLALTLISFSVANKLTTAANTIVLQYTSPIFIVVISALFLHKKPSRADIITVILTLLGISLFFFDQLKPGYLIGNFVAISAGLFLAVTMIIVSSGGTEEEKMGGLLIGHGLVTVTGFFFALLYPPVFSAKSVISILILGIFQLGIPYVLFTKASRYCPALACSLLSALEPLLNPVWVMIFDGETPGIFALIGGIIVIATVCGWCIYTSRHPKPA